MDVIESRGRSVEHRARWSGWFRGRWTAAVAAVLLLVAPVLVLAGGRVEQWWAERSLRDQVAVVAELDVSASSTAWTPSGRGRLDYSLRLRNVSPRVVRVSRVRGGQDGLRLLGRGLSTQQVLPGTQVHVPLSVELDYRRCGSSAPTAVVLLQVEVVAASGRPALVSTVLHGSAPLTGVARMLCRLDPALHIEQLSGPISP